MENDSFFRKVYEVTKKIPFGRITTYGAIAKYLGTARSARMVGWALNNCHTLPEYIPAHRVVNRNGMLTGKHHFGGTNVMKELLESEGIKISDNRIINFHEKYWEPIKELFV
ncbi:MAG: MGMT family protein [Bacteroidales bacterium]|nr:MGMT family protein [Bacteroidales bacterium]